VESGDILVMYVCVFQWSLKHLTYSRQLCVEGYARLCPLFTVVVICVGTFKRTDETVTSDYGLGVRPTAAFHS
jgi:hypothetical protein